MATSATAPARPRNYDGEHGRLLGVVQVIAIKADSVLAVYTGPGDARQLRDRLREISEYAKNTLAELDVS